MNQVFMGGDDDQEHSSAFISADYEAFKPQTLRGFVVHLNGRNETFSDYDEALKWSFNQGVEVLNSSSVDDYFSDLRRRQ